MEEALLFPRSFQQLPLSLDKKFKNTEQLMNLVEESEKKSNSQLLKEYVLALPDDKNVSLEMKHVDEAIEKIDKAFSGI